MKSTSGGDGSYTLTVSFEVGSDPDLNTVNVNNRVNQALAQLPPEVQRNGVTAKKQSSAMLQVVAIYLAQGQPRRAVPVELRHHQHARHAEARAGRRRGEPVRRPRLLDAHLAQPRPHGEPRHHDRGRGQRGPVAERAGRRRPRRRRAADGRRRAAAQHHDARAASPRRGIREHRGPRHVRRRAGARQGHRPVELGSKTSDSQARYNGRPAAGIAIYQLPGANALATAEAVRRSSRRWSPASPRMSPTT